MGVHKSHIEEVLEDDGRIFRTHRLMAAKRGRSICVWSSLLLLLASALLWLSLRVFSKPAEAVQRVP